MARIRIIRSFRYLEKGVIYEVRDRQHIVIAFEDRTSFTTVAIVSELFRSRCLSLVYLWLI